MSHILRGLFANCRCWNYSTQTGSDSKYTDLCERCTPVMEQLGFISGPKAAVAANSHQSWGLSSIVYVILTKHLNLTYTDASLPTFIYSCFWSEPCISSFQFWSDPVTEYLLSIFFVENDTGWALQIAHSAPPLAMLLPEATLITDTGVTTIMSKWNGLLKWMQGPEYVPKCSCKLASLQVSVLSQWQLDHDYTWHTCHDTITRSTSTQIWYQILSWLRKQQTVTPFV